MVRRSMGPAARDASFTWLQPSKCSFSIAGKVSTGPEVVDEFGVVVLPKVD
jgi:hypothetical protein